MGAVGENRYEYNLDMNLKSAYEQLGKIYYENNKGGNVEEVYKEAFERINSLYEEKQKIEIKMLAKMGKRKCEHCLSIVTIESRFCNMCGGVLAELPNDLVEEKMASLPRTCMQCGAVLDEEAVFCATCGCKCG